MKFVYKVLLLMTLVSASSCDDRTDQPESNIDKPSNSQNENIGSDVKDIQESEIDIHYSSSCNIRFANNDLEQSTGQQYFFTFHENSEVTLGYAHSIGINCANIDSSWYFRVQIKSSEEILPSGEFYNKVEYVDWVSVEIDGELINKANYLIKGFDNEVFYEAWVDEFGNEAAYRVVGDTLFLARNDEKIGTLPKWNYEHLVFYRASAFSY